MHDENPSRSITAAPNESLLKIKLITCNRSAEDARKWMLCFEIMAVTAVFGPQFAKPGKNAEGFSFETFQAFKPGDIVNVHAEYLGDAHRGYYQITRPQRPS